MERELIEILKLAVLIGLLPAILARNKGRSLLLWWFYGAMLFIVALPHEIFIKPDNQEAKVCQYCGMLLYD